MNFLILGMLALGGWFFFTGSNPTCLSFSPKGKKILFLGDSISAGKGTAGGQLVALLRAAGAEVTVNALGGRSAASFVRGSRGLKEPEKGLLQLADAVNDGIDTAIIFLGTNDLAGLAVGNTKEQTIKPFRAIVTQLRTAGVEVYGIGAPHYEKRPDLVDYEDGLREELEDVYGRGRFIDAGPLTGSYYMHAGGAKAKDFAARLFACLTGEK